MGIYSLQDWFDEPGKRPFIIAGPCSAESEEQVLETADLINGEYRPTRSTA